MFRLLNVHILVYSTPSTEVALSQTVDAAVRGAWHTYQSSRLFYTINVRKGEVFFCFFCFLKNNKVRPLLCKTQHVNDRLIFSTTLFSGSSHTARLFNVYILICKSSEKNTAVVAVRHASLTVAEPIGCRYV